MKITGDGSFIFTLSSDELASGLRKRSTLPRNSPNMIELVGMIGIDKVLQTLDELTLIDTSELSESFPFPQLFILSSTVIICGETSIYEYYNGTITHKITASRVGSTWRVLDYGGYIIMSNGVVTITKDPITDLYSEDVTLPIFNASCDFNGQVLIGNAQDYAYTPWVTTPAPTTAIPTTVPSTTVSPTTIAPTTTAPTTAAPPTFNAFTTGDSGKVFNSNAIWATARSASSGSSINDTSMRCGVSTTTPGIYGISRSFALFDLSEVTGTITSAIWHGYTEGLSNCTACLQASSFDGTLDVDCFNDVTGSELGHNSIVPVSWNSITLNATGIAYLQSCIGGNCPLALREYTYDFLNSAPGSGALIYGTAVNSVGVHNQYLEIITS
jgi:hypothetical protein